MQEAHEGEALLLVDRELLIPGLALVQPAGEMAEIEELQRLGDRLVGERAGGGGIRDGSRSVPIGR